MSGGLVAKRRDSLLTTTSGYTNYRGILNLVIILLVLSNGRVALENVMKYGILVDPLSWLLFFGEGSKHWPALLIIFGLPAHILISLCTEKIIAHLHSKHMQQSTKIKASNINTTTTTSTTINNNDNNNRKTTTTTTTMSPNETVLAFFYIVDAAIVINLLACIALPPLIIYTRDTHPISTSAALMFVSIVFLKLVSYHMFNFWCRDVQCDDKHQSRTTRSFLRSYIPPALELTRFHERNSVSNSGQQMPPLTTAISTESTASSTSSSSCSSPTNNLNSSTRAVSSTTSAIRDENRKTALKILAKYPENLTLDDISSYIAFPTLCYELEYTRTERIRKRFLVKRIVELLVLSQLDLALVQQWIVPTVSNSVLPFRHMQVSHMLERLLKLAIPNHVIWLIWFYLFFHSFLNIMAELTRFADREFYRDWWNSESVYYFWSNWNIPVHNWCVRHLYVPLLAIGFNKCQASTAVFFVSAFFHEYLVSVPLQVFRMWAFTGMLIQLPWARFVSAYFNNQFANVAVWVSLIIGQPLCILMYYHDYYVISNVKIPIKSP